MVAEDHDHTDGGSGNHVRGVIRNELRQLEARLELRSVAPVRAVESEALQLRLQALCDAKLLEDEELFALEDKIADGALETADGDAAGGAAASVGVGVDVSGRECVAQLVALSKAIALDPTFSRQLRRKFL